MRDLVELIDQVLAERRWSARQVSIEACGNPHQIARMRAGQVPSAERLSALCDVLGLEFYVGRRRQLPAESLDVSRLGLALEALDASFPGWDRDLAVSDRAQLIVAVHRLIDDRAPASSAEDVRALIAIARRFGVADAVGRKGD